MRTPQVLALMIAVVVLVGCPATKQARDVTRSGFLADFYPMMRKGKEGEALLIYKSPKVHPGMRGGYSKIMLDPVTIWRGHESRQAGISSGDAHHIADMFYSLIYLELAKDYEMVDKPGPHTLRIQVAITKLEESHVVLDVISTVPAPMNVLAVESRVQGLVTGKPSFVGEASIEMKIKDAQTGEVLGAGVDRRVGGKKLDAESFDSWGDVYETLAFWAKQARFRFCRERGEAECVRPEA